MALQLSTTYDDTARSWAKAGYTVNGDLSAHLTGTCKARRFGRLMTIVDLDGRIGLCCHDCRMVWGSDKLPGNGNAALESVLPHVMAYAGLEIQLDAETVRGEVQVEKRNKGGLFEVRCPSCKQWRTLSERRYSEIGRWGDTGLCRSCGLGKVSEQRAKEICEEYARWPGTLTDFAMRMEVSTATASRIVRVDDEARLPVTIRRLSAEDYEIQCPHCEKWRAADRRVALEAQHHRRTCINCAAKIRRRRKG